MTPDLLIAKYRMTFFANEQTLEVFNDILQDCSFFCKLNDGDSSQIAAHNIAKGLLEKCGVLNDENTRAITFALAGILPPASLTGESPTDT
jgi:hypothetical protein